MFLSPPWLSLKQIYSSVADYWSCKVFWVHACSSLVCKTCIKRWWQFVTMDVSGIHFQQLIFLSEKPLKPINSWKLYCPLSASILNLETRVPWVKGFHGVIFRDVASLGSTDLISVDSGASRHQKWTCGETYWFSCSNRLKEVNLQKTHKPPEVIDLMLSDLVLPQWNEDDRLVNKLKKQVFALVVLEGYGSAVGQPLKWSLIPHSEGFEGGWGNYHEYHIISFSFMFFVNYW